MGSMFPLLKHCHNTGSEMRSQWIKIITKQISSVAAISSVSLISCFFHSVPHSVESTLALFKSIKSQHTQMQDTTSNI